MKFNVDLNAEPIVRAFAMMAEAARDLNKPLKEFDAYYAKRVQQRFDDGGPGWPPLAKGGAARNAQKANRSFMKKLGREAWRAADKLDMKAKAEVDARAQRGVDEQGDATWKKASKATQSAFKALQRRVQTIEEARRMLTGQGASEAMKPKAQEKLAARVGRAEARGGKMLGSRLPQSFKSKIRNGTLTRSSDIPWAGIHNEGGKVGRGAEIPARPFLFWDEDDMTKLAEILKRHLADAAEA